MKNEKKGRRKPAKISKAKFQKPIFGIIFLKIILILAGIGAISGLFFYDIQAESVLGPVIANGNIWKYVAFVLIAYIVFFFYKKLDIWEYNLGHRLDHFKPEKEWKRNRLGIPPYKPIKKRNK
ncbi:MAG: hypothetical protein WC908_03585 [Candidatus Paceibacterota bacterium]